MAFCISFYGTYYQEIHIVESNENVRGESLEKWWGGGNFQFAGFCFNFLCYSLNAYFLFSHFFIFPTPPTPVTFVHVAVRP